MSTTVLNYILEVYLKMLLLNFIRYYYYYVYNVKYTYMMACNIDFFPNVDHNFVNVYFFIFTIINHANVCLLINRYCMCMQYSHIT